MLDPTNLYEIETQSRLNYQERLHEAEQWRLAKLATQEARPQSNQLAPKPSLFSAFLRRLLPVGQPKISHAKAVKTVKPIM